MSMDEDGKAIYEKYMREMELKIQAQQAATAMKQAQLQQAALLALQKWEAQLEAEVENKKRKARQILPEPDFSLEEIEAADKIINGM